MASAAEALEVGRRGHDFDVIVSDLEMPEMTGYEFAEAIKAGKALGACGTDCTVGQQLAGGDRQGPCQRLLGICRQV